MPNNNLLIQIFSNFAVQEAVRAVYPNPTGLYLIVKCNKPEEIYFERIDRVRKSPTGVITYDCGQAGGFNESHYRIESISFCPVGFDPEFSCTQLDRVLMAKLELDNFSELDKEFFSWNYSKQPPNFDENIAWNNQSDLVKKSLWLAELCGERAEASKELIDAIDKGTKEKFIFNLSGKGVIHALGLEEK